MSMQFNEEYYLENNTDVADAVAAGDLDSGKQHWELFGAEEGRNPNADFNTSEYLAANPDVAQAGVNPLTHFLTYGAAEGRAPSAAYAEVAKGFDEPAYLEANTDVAAAVDAGDFASGYEHWVKFGQFEDARPEATYNEGTPVSDAIGGETAPSELTEALANLQEARNDVSTFLENALDNEAIAEQADDNASAAAEGNITTALASAATDLGGEVSAVTSGTSVSVESTAFSGASDTVKNAYIADAEAAASAAVTSAQEGVDTAEANAGSQLLNAIGTVEARTTSHEDAIAAAKAAANELVGATASFEAANSGLVSAINGVSGTSLSGSISSIAVSSDALVVNTSGTTSSTATIAKLNSAGDWELNSVGTAIASGLSNVDQLLAALDANTAGIKGEASALTNLQNSIESVIKIDNGSDAINVDWASGTNAGNIISSANGEVTVNLGVSASSSSFSGSGVPSSGNIADTADTVLDARTALTKAEKAQSDLSDAISDYRDLGQVKSDYDDLVEATDKAEAAIIDSEEDGGLGVTLLEGDTDFTIGDDVYLFSEDSNGATLSSFGNNGEDNIFFGKEFSLVEVNADGITGDNGDANALEIFWEQGGADLNLFVEGRATAGNGSSDSVDLTQVTLTGVDAADLQDNLATNGFLTAGTAADIA